MEPAKLKDIGYAAPLPDHFQWGSDALENYEFGKRRATDAIVAALANSPRPVFAEPNPEWEAKAAALRAATPEDDHTSSWEDVGQTLNMLRTWTADAEPANEHGQISFSRAMLESCESTLAWALANRPAGASVD